MLTKTRRMRLPQIGSLTSSTVINVTPDVAGLDGQPRHIKYSKRETSLLKIKFRITP
jgi:hypothetical protein